MPSPREKILETVLKHINDGKRIGFIKTGMQPLDKFLKPFHCVIQGPPSRMGFMCVCLVLAMNLWNDYNRTGDRAFYRKYKQQKDLWFDSTIEPELMPLMQEKFDKMVRQGGKTANQSLDVYDLIKLQDALHEEQLFISEVNPTDRLFYCCFTGPIRANIICLLKEGESYYGVKDIGIFVSKCCNLSACC